MTGALFATSDGYVLAPQAAQNSQDQQRLMAEGMTAAEACNALDAALAEGRRAGSAAEERQQACDRAARERRAQALGTGALEVEAGKLASPSAPADAVASLDPEEYARAAEHKARGNAAFGARNFTAAAAAYEVARGVYGARGGASGEQREEKVKICSNLAECFLKLERWEEAP